MTSGHCSRRWEIEAVRDGRLMSPDGDSLAVHVKNCTVCRREALALDALGARLQGEALGADVVSVRRVRQRLLERASRSLHGGASAVRPWMLFCAGAAVLACLIGGILYRAGPRIAAGGSVAVKALPGAIFQRSPAADGERIDLRDGTLELEVTRRPGEPGLVVRVPDGEIEDVGTVFAVTVAAERTLSIAVTTGVVVFHRQDATDIVVRPGAPYAGDPETQAPERRDSPETTAEGVDPRTMPAEPSGPPPAPAATAKHPPAVPVPRDAEHAPAAAPADAVAPGVQGEDASYLRIVALLREGRTREARLAAGEYLTHFPGGFRRQEIQRVLETASKGLEAGAPASAPR